MKKRVWVNMLMVILVAGLFLTVSCAKKTVVSDAAIVEGSEKVKAEAERVAQQKLEEHRIQEQALLEAKIKAAKKRFENQNIHFEYDSSQLSSMAKTILIEKAAWLKANNFVSVVIEGHCDDRGTIEYNTALGGQRASAAKAYLINLGVSAARLETTSYGEEQPLDSGKTEQAFQKNRRAHFVIK